MRGRTEGSRVSCGVQCARKITKLEGNGKAHKQAQEIARDCTLGVRLTTKRREIMNSNTDRKQAGVVLIPVLLLLTLFGVVGLTFTFYASEVMCERNPTTEIRDGRCVREVGPDRHPAP
jgi:hypothetical protein